jgi:hypothetical protein
MDWARLDSRMPGEISVSDADRKTIQQVAEEAILKGDHDPEIVLDAAAKALSRVDVIENLRAYARRTIVRAIKKTTIAQARKDPLAASSSLEGLCNLADNDKIENAILVRELLDTLAPLDREIFVRKMEGETFPEIDSEMSLRPRTAEFRFRVCRTLMRQTLNEKRNSGKSLRVR